MADALISVVLEQLACYVQNEVTIVLSAGEEVDRLTANLKLVQAVLTDANQKQIENRAVKLWLDDLKHVVYDADDVLDEWRTRALLRNHVDPTAGNRKKVRSYLLSPFYCFKSGLVYRDIGHQIKKINERLGLITEQRNNYDLRIDSKQPVELRQLTSSAVDVSKIHGRHHTKEYIMGRLLGESSHAGPTPHVISILGQAGLGKTALAKLIHSDERVDKSFEIKMWVCVSVPFDLVGLAKATIKEAEGDVPDSIEWQEVQKCLGKSVKGKRFLLVLDDVSTENLDHWNQLKLSLSGGAPGSRIIVTTREQSVVKLVGSTDVHDLKKLEDEDSWSVLRDVALAGREELDEFENIGRKLASKCKGIPLAIITLASLLLQSKRIEDWTEILESHLWEMPRMEKFFLPPLFMSYYSLDSISKQCFLYCAVFPEDTEINKSDLIKLWMAQGFFGFEETGDLERIGGKHFNILTGSQFFQDYKKDSDGNILTCKMHDLVREFAKHLTQVECFTMETDAAKFDNKRIRHFHARGLENRSILEAKKLRTLVLHKEATVPSKIFHKLICLRSLDLSYSRLEVLPNEVEKLVHLRYLDLSGTELLELPETICNLYNLQSLKLNECKKLHKLPEGIGKLSNLRHLEFIGTVALRFLPETIAALSSLRTLCNFSESGLDLRGKIGVLKLLNNLQGALELKGLNQVTDENEVIQAELKMKRKLRALTYNFELSEEESDAVMMKSVFEKLQSHAGLEILDVQYYPCSHFPYWVQNCSLLPKIVEIRLYMCNGCTFLPALGQLTSLVTLRIEGMDSVKHIVLGSLA
ncbi:hypothetical protein ACHQM5_025014 [Ranunculus cassubicifolius]